MNLFNIKSKHNTPIKNLSNTLGSSQKKEITIEDIWNVITSQDSGLKSINKRLISVEFSINSFKDTVKNLNLEVFKLKEQNANLTTEIESLKNKLSKLEHCNVYHSNCQTKDINVVHEVQERLHRSKNLLVFNAPDKHDESVDNTVQIVNDILQTMNLQLTVVKTKRLGNFHCKPRPILVELSSWNDVTMVLKAKSCLRNVDRWRGVWIGPDMTTIQREHINSLRNELLHKLKLGEINWIIKYVNRIQILQLVKKKNNKKKIIKTSIKFKIIFDSFDGFLCMLEKNINNRVKC